ncbi:fumarylacetoacetate hydrolase family protein [Streptomyces sp. GD-15H]|uniref:2-keto-4-pentenoate hydratase n=1 Tax=Streptomyces sp. GD-15H TaxID=3129112 RepID=UPI003256140F
MTDRRMLAARLDEAVRTAVPIPQLTAETELDLEEAYAVQAAGVALRVDRGERPVGVKLGFTSKAKAEQMGVSDVIIGVLTSGMEVADGGVADVDRMIHPRVEPEVAFRLGRDIDPHDPDDDPLTAVDAVAPALEIIDSRYRDFRFSLADVVADNTSACAFVIGPWQQPGSADLSDLPVDLHVDGEVVATGSSADILGHPERALEAIKRMARLHGIALPAGAVVLAGAATAAAPLTAGREVVATVGDLGRVSVRTAGVEAHDG